MEVSGWVNNLFRTLDAGDIDGFVRFLSDRPLFRMGSSQPLEGRETVRAGVSGFLSSIKSMKHSLSDTLVSGDTVVVHGIVTYTRLDESELVVPFANIFYLEDEKIRDYLVFVDNTEL